MKVARKRFMVALDHWKEILDEYREAGRKVEEILGSGMEKRGDENELKVSRNMVFRKLLDTLH